MINIHSHILPHLNDAPSDWHISLKMCQQAIAQQLIPIFELKLSDYSYGFRPDRNKHQVIKKAKEYMNEGYT